ncbi:D-Ala-D-Ala dipeptidase VanX [Pseudolysinimonas kribbensis]
MIDDFVVIDEVVPGVRWDAKYATWDNFTGRPVDGYDANRVVGTTALGRALARAQERAGSLGYGLLLWDGYRPQRATEQFRRWSAQPEDRLTKARHYPRIDRAEMFERGYIHARSGHSRGSAIDLTLFELDGRDLVPMGGGHDLMDALSHHGSTGVSPLERAGRRSLRTIMELSGFRPYEREWWHYSLLEEPYPDTYFDFTVAAVVSASTPVMYAASVS